MSTIGRKKKLFYGLVLAAAVVGLLIDRMGMMGGPEDGDGVAPVDSVALTEARSAAEPITGPRIARVFEDRSTEPDGSAGELTTLPAPDTRDAFALSPRMQQCYEKAALEQQAAQELQAQDEEKLRQQELDRFRHTHELKGTSVKGVDAWAIVDGRIMRIGDHLEGFALQRIEDYRITFAKDESTVVTLTLPVPFNVQVPGAESR